MSDRQEVETNVANATSYMDYLPVPKSVPERLAVIERLVIENGRAIETLETWMATGMGALTLLLLAAVIHRVMSGPRR